MKLAISGRRGHPKLLGDGARASHVEFHEQHEDLLLTGRELGRRRGRRLGVGLEDRLLRHLDGDHRAAAEVVLDRDRAAQEAKRFTGDGQARADAPDETPLIGGRRGEAGQEGPVLVVDARSVVGDAQYPAAVEDSYHDVAEEGVDQVLDELVDDREGYVAALFPARVVGLLGKRGDQPRDVALLDADHAGWAGERVVDGDPWGARPERRIGGWGLGEGGFGSRRIFAGAGRGLDVGRTWPRGRLIDGRGGLAA